MSAVVQARFVAIPPALAQRIAAADSAALDTLIVRAATIERLEDL